jgi:hypothetical protein
LFPPERGIEKIVEAWEMDKKDNTSTEAMKQGFADKMVLLMGYAQQRINLLTHPKM